MALYRSQGIYVFLKTKILNPDTSATGRLLGPFQPKEFSEQGNITVCPKAQQFF